MTVNAFRDSDALLSGPASAQGGWFDRTYFNGHCGTTLPYLLLGLGAYPGSRSADAYVIAVTRDEQVNLRLGEPLAPGAAATGVGPLRVAMIEPLRRWSLTLGDNPSGIRFELEWEANTAFWSCRPMHLDDGRGQHAAFDHGFQAGRLRGWLSLDGAGMAVDGWHSQRDRSRGTRIAVARQGVHTWVQARFEAGCLGFNLDLDRENRPVLLDGAWMGHDGSLDPVVDVKHALQFDASLELQSGRFEVSTASGRLLQLHADLYGCGGGYLAGGGYGGWHGQVRSEQFAEHERWPLSDTGRMRRLATPLVDRLCRFTLEESARASEQGSGIFEFAHSRSASYRYQPGV